MKELIDELKACANGQPLDAYASIMTSAADALESQAREISDLRQWKREQMEVMGPVFDYAQLACTGPLGCSITEWLIADHANQAREIERLSQHIEQQDDAYALLSLDAGRKMDELEQGLAALKTQPTRVVLPEREWLQSGSLIYSLENGVNHYEINVNQAAGSRHGESREHLASELLKVLNGTRLNQPASGGDERAAFEAAAAETYKGWAVGRDLGEVYRTSSWTGTGYLNAYTDLAWGLWKKARAAHPVREAVAEGCGFDPEPFIATIYMIRDAYAAAISVAYAPGSEAFISAKDKAQKLEKNLAKLIRIAAAPSPSREGE